MSAITQTIKNPRRTNTTGIILEAGILNQNFALFNNSTPNA